MCSTKSNEEIRTQMNIVAIIQARMGSTRLPGKVLMDLAGKPMLERVIRRTGRATRLSEVVVATTTNPQDRVIARLCHDLGVPFTCGSEFDVLDRYYQAAVRYHADAIVRITADCPLIDPGIIDNVISEFLNLPYVDYVSNTFSLRTFPRGLDVEVMQFKALERARTLDRSRLSREHVTRYIHQRPDIFSIRAYWHTEDLSKFRWTVDTPEDLKLLRLIFSSFNNDEFTWLEVVDLLEANPDLNLINSHIVQKEIQ